MNDGDKTVTGRQKAAQSAAELQRFAAELASAKRATQAQPAERSAERSEEGAVERSVERSRDQAAGDLPAFRDSSLQETRQAEQLLRDAHMYRRQERFREAETKCREALALVPRDAAALELLGDLLQGVARTEAALAAYKRATEADPKRVSAERKYADLLLLQQSWSPEIDPEAPRRNPNHAAFLSALLPGAGQFYNGEWIKGAAIVLGVALCISGWTLFGRSNESAAPVRPGSPVRRSDTAPPTTVIASRRSQGIHWGAMVPFLLGGVLYVYAVADAGMTAKRLNTVNA